LPEHSDQRAVRDQVHQQEGAPVRKRRFKQHLPVEGLGNAGD